MLLGIKIETVRALSNVEQTLTVPGIGFAEWGPGDLHMSFGIWRDPTRPLDPRLVEERVRVRDACRAREIPFLAARTPEDVTQGIVERVRIVAGGSAETAGIGRAHTRRTMPV